MKSINRISLSIDDFATNFLSADKTGIRVRYESAVPPIKSRSVTRRQHRRFSGIEQVRWPPPSRVYLVKIPPRRRMNSTNFTRRYATSHWSWCPFIRSVSGKINPRVRDYSRKYIWSSDSDKCHFRVPMKWQWVLL